MVFPAVFPVHLGRWYLKPNTVTRKLRSSAINQHGLSKSPSSLTGWVRALGHRV